MPVPTEYDRQLAEIETGATGIVSLVRTMHWAAARDLPGMRARLREELQDFVDQAMAMADSK
jgi:hypothetical protein